MRIISLTLLALSLVSRLPAQQVTWVSTTKNDHWATAKISASHCSSGTTDVEINTWKTKRTITGFGGCFNELGWTALQCLSATDRQAVLKELFTPAGANFSICRMPVGANDFSSAWYSYDETDGDFALKNFTIAHDRQTLIPFIKAAQKYNPLLQIWASPWSPPQWMKKNKHYAEAASSVKENGIDNGLKPDQVGNEGTDMFIQQPRYFDAYARYFGRFIDAYRQAGIKIGMVMPQNEFNSAQIFPSCTWTAHGLATFIGYLGPEMEKRGVKVFFGTVERPDQKLTDTVLTDPPIAKYISGVGFQWAGKGAIAGIHARYPRLILYQSEQECGDGKNDWSYCLYTWSLMKHYFNSGASAYMYWNIALKEGGISHWGWRQNSLVSVDTTQKTYHFNYEYYLLKHLSHFVKPGAKLLSTAGTFQNLLAFKNPDNSIVLILQNDSNTDTRLRLKVDDKTITPLLKAGSFNTFLIKRKKRG